MFFARHMSVQKNRLHFIPALARAGSLRRCFLTQPLLPQNANPNQGTYMGTVTAPLPEQCATTAKTSEWERAGHKKRGAGGIPPRLFASGLSLEKAWIPRPGPGGKPPRRSEPTPVPTRFPPCQRQPGAACPLSGCLGSHPRGAAPRGPRLPGGGPHFSREMGRKRAGGKPPGPPVFMAARSHSLGLGMVGFDPFEELFLPIS